MTPNELSGTTATDTSAPSISTSTSINSTVSEPAASTSSETTSAQSQQTAVTNQQEKMLSQSEVNKIVGKTRQEERERVERAAREEIARLQAQYQQPAQMPQTQQTFGGMPQQIDENKIRQLIDEQAQLKVMQQKHYEVANSFISKLDAAKTKYEDYDTVTKDLNIMQMPVSVVEQLNRFDNAGDMMYELGKYPTKLALIAPLFNYPNLAEKALRDLSDSIRQNETAPRSIAPTNPHLSQVQPSTTATDSGRLSVSDLRTNPLLRG